MTDHSKANAKVVFAEVELSGYVVEGESGYKASKARVVHMMGTEKNMVLVYHNNELYSIPNLSNISGCFNGNSTISLIFLTSSFKPPISS